MKCLQLLLMCILVQVYCDDDPTSYIPRGIFLPPTSNTSQSSLNQGLKLIKGIVAKKGQFPYQVALGVFLPTKVFFCNGVLLTTTTVVTAAHCVQGAEEIKIFLGFLDIMDYEEEGTVTDYVDPSYVKSHPAYNPKNYYNDIAIIRLTQPVTLSKYIKTAKLPKDPFTVNNSTILTITGWGKTSQNSQPIADQLHYYIISGQDFTPCAAFFDKTSSYTLSTNTFCTSGAGGVGPCKGDSGAPLARVNSDGTYTVFGVHSIGLVSCEVSAPAAHTNLYLYRDWIKANSDYKD